MALPALPAFPYGAVYYRYSNPPQADWARDYATAAADGMNVFRHWFLWSAIEVAPGEFDWSGYDRQLDLAAQHGMKTIIAEMITAAPEWAYRLYDHARLETRDGRKVGSSMSASCVTGGFPGLCLDHADYRALAARFLRALVERYRDHPGLGGYDIWNECNYSPDTCYCPATAEAFRAWLRHKYGDDTPRAVARAWHRPSLAEWEDVVPPRSLGPYPDVLDWLAFRQDNAYGYMQWRADLIRSLDPHHPVVAHGIAASLSGAAPRGADDWRAAAVVDAYGYTWGSSRHGDEPWKQPHAVDLVRAAARGKPFWHAEAYAGPLWMQGNVLGKPRNEGRIASPEDVRYWDMVSFMCGATGLMYLRWRPLLDGPLFGAFGPYGLDGSRTHRSAMASQVARWVAAPEQQALWRSRPVRGEVGIVYVPETQAFLYAQQGDTRLYSRSMEGAYQGFLDARIQADWVHIDHIDEYRVLYLPIPVALPARTAGMLRDWVAAGGALICEGCPGYFDERGHVGTVQPGLGLDEVLGAREAYVEFTPDLLEDERLTVAGREVWGGVFLQSYTPAGGTPAGYDAQGRVAVVDHAYGRGRTRLVGAMLGYGYGGHPGKRDSALFADLLAWAGGSPHVWRSDERIIARLHDGEGGAYLWVANPTREPVEVTLRLAEKWRGLRPGAPLWGAAAEPVGEELRMVAGARDVAVVPLR